MSGANNPVWTPERKAAAVASLKDPVLFSERLLQAFVWPLQAEILRSVVTNQRTAVKACHSSGKTFLAACAVLFWLARYKKSIVVTTAPTAVQVEKLLWGEVHAALARSRYPFPKPLLTELKFNSSRYAIGFTTSVTKGNLGVRFQGFHEDHVLIICDEAPGIEPAIFSAIDGIRAGGHVSLLLLGNPTIASGPFFDAFGKDREGWKTFTISAFDTPNLQGITLEDLLAMSPEDLAISDRPYLTTRQWVKEKYYEWGPGHPAWESRVLGQFPSQSDDALISLAWLEAAQRSELALPKVKARAGLDVAGPGEDNTVLTIRRGPRLIDQKAWSNADPRGEVVAALRPYHEAGDLESVNVDSIGIGWGMHTHLLELGYPSVPINVGEAARDSEKFANLKAELYWGLRLRAEAGDLSGSFNEKTVGQLAGIRYKQNARGQLQIESKEDARKRGVHSPDNAESVMLAYAEHGTGLAIYRTLFTEDLIYNESAMPLGFGNHGSYQERTITIGYGVATAMCFLEILDTGTIIYVSREYFVEGNQSTKPKNDAEYADDLAMFCRGEHPVTHEKVLRHPNDAVIVLDAEAVNFGIEITQRDLYRMNADTELSHGIQMVGTLFEKKMVRVSSTCRHFISEHKGYSWDSKKLARGVEEPVNTNKQTVEAFRLYVKTRVGNWRLAD